MDPLTGSVLVTVCSCRLGKTLCHGAVNSLHVSACQPPSASLSLFVHAMYISTYCSHCVALYENKVILSILCAWHHTHLEVHTHTKTHTA